MLKLESLSDKNKKKYFKLIESFKANGDAEALATYKSMEQMKTDGYISEKKYKTFSEFVKDIVKEEAVDINQDGIIDNADVELALEELDITTRLEDDLVEFLIVSAENDLIPDDMLDGIFELISDHVDLSEFEDESDVQEEDITGYTCDIEEVRALALIRKKGGKRRVRCTSGPNKGRIRVAGQCGKKVNLKLSRKLKRSKGRISSAAKSRTAKKAARTASKRGTRR